MAMVDVGIIGAGVVGVSVAIQLRQRGLAVALIDRTGIAAGASAGNAGLIERSAVTPVAFPRSLSVLLRMAANRSPEVHYHFGQLCRLIPWLWRYWRNSTPQRLRIAAEALLPLIEESLAEHRRFLSLAGMAAEIREGGWIDLYRTQSAYGRATKEAADLAREHDLSHMLLDYRALKAEWPDIRDVIAGGIAWPDSASVSDPKRVVEGYAAFAIRSGVEFRIGDARSLVSRNGVWSLSTDRGPLSATNIVIATGIWSREILARLGYGVPLEAKRGYHIHLADHRNEGCRRPLIDAERGYVLSPMDRGIRLTTGVEFADIRSPATPIQVERAEHSARELLPIGHRLDQVAWMGYRPCLPDMLPVIGPAPRERGLWFAFGHAHHGFTLGPISGRILADTIVDPKAVEAFRSLSIKRFFR